MKDLHLFFNKIKTIRFFQRIFQWRQLRTLSYDAYEALNTLENKLRNWKSDF